jgi:hypothetical protein
VKQFRVDIEILVLNEFLHAYWTILKISDLWWFSYIFSWIKPLINAIIMKCMQAGKHATKIAIIKFILADGATTWGIMKRDLHLGNHGDIFEINEVRFDPWESLLLDFRFYRWEVDISSNCTIIIAHLRWLRIINVNEMLILGLIFDLSELSLINIRNSLIDVLHSNDISFLLIATSNYHSDEKDDCDY